MQTLSEFVKNFKSEALMLLRFQLAFKRNLHCNDLDSIGRSELVDRLISSKAIENEMVIRICKFNNKSRNDLTFKNALKKIPNNHPYFQDIKERVREFEENIFDHLKYRRDKQLAHLEIGFEDNKFEITYDLTPIIRIVVEIIDLMNESKVDYSWKDGSFEKFDLRKSVLNE